MVRRAGFRVDDQSVYVAITEIESGKPATGEWGQYLTDLVRSMTIAR